MKIKEIKLNDTDFIRQPLTESFLKDSEEIDQDIDSEVSDTTELDENMLSIMDMLQNKKANYYRHADGTPYEGDI